MIFIPIFEIKVLIRRNSYGYEKFKYEKRNIDNER